MHGDGDYNDVCLVIVSRTHHCSHHVHGDGGCSDVCILMVMVMELVITMMSAW